MTNALAQSKPVMNVLHFAEDSDTSGYFPALARWHDRDRVRMTFGTLRPSDPQLVQLMKGHGVDCVSAGSRTRATHPLALLRLFRLLRRARFDLFHAHLFEPAVVGLPAAALAGTPLRVLTRHHSDYHTRIGRRWHTLLDRSCTALAHRVIAVSQSTAEHLIARERAPVGKVTPILNGVDFDRINPSRGARARLRIELDVRDRTLLLMVARLHPEKGHSFLFRALRDLRDVHGDRFLLALAGTGTFEEDYRREVDGLGCSACVRFLGFRTDVVDLMKAADVLVLPSVAEAFGLVLVEALYLGTPIVASRVGGIPEIVDDEIDGILVPPGDPEALGSAILRVVDAGAIEAAARASAREKVVSRFGFERMVREYERLYEDLARQRVGA